MIDVNVSYGSWPFRSLSPATAGKLAEALSMNGIEKAVVSSIDSLLRDDIEKCNEELASAVAPFKNLYPLPTVNPLHGNFMESLSENALNAVRIAPSYHKYSILSEECFSLASALTEKKFALVIQIRVEDERAHNPVCLVPSVPVNDIIAFAQKFPSLRILCLCPFLSELIVLCNASGNICCDISFAETFNTVRRLLKDVGPEKILFGSNAPFMYMKAASMKIEYAEANDGDIKKIAFENAGSLFKL